jgi:hypothetical protein
MLASSHYLIAFRRIGYNNTHPLAFSFLAMLMLVFSWRTQRVVFVYATGVATGCCLYAFQVALLTWPTALVALIIIFLRRPRWQMALAGAAMWMWSSSAIVPCWPRPS